MAFFRDNMKYIEFNKNNPRCIHCFINDRAYASVITEVMTNGQNETGGVFLGYIVNRAWYIVESVDPGIDTVNQVAFFEWDTEYVNHQAERLSKIYHKPLTVVGFWHRHPGSMDYFSGQDETTIRTNLRELRAGLLSMLVNIDPKLRMTYYYCYGNEIMKIRYDVGDKYFPAELMKYADATELSRRANANGKYLDIHYEQVINLDAVAARKKTSTNNKPLGEKKTSPITSNVSVSASRDSFEQSNTYSNRIPKETIKQIAEIVVGVERDTDSRIEQLYNKISLLEEAIKLLLEKSNAVLSKVNSAEVTEPQEALTQEAVEKIVKITTKTIMEMASKDKYASTLDINNEASNFGTGNEVGNSDKKMDTSNSDLETKVLKTEGTNIQNCEDETGKSVPADIVDNAEESVVNEE